MTVIHTQDFPCRPPGTISIRELAYLRATNLGITNNTLFQRLLIEIPERIKEGQLTPTYWDEPIWEGKWKYTRDHDRRREGPSIHVTVINGREQVTDFCTTSNGKPPPNANTAEKVFTFKRHDLLTISEAQHLYELDPIGWSPKSLQWADIRPDVADGERATEPARPTPQVSEIDKRHEARALEKANRICRELFINPDVPMKPAILYEKIKPLMILEGYTEKQIDVCWDRPEDLPQSCRPIRGKHSPIGVLTHLFMQPAKGTRNQGATVHDAPRLKAVFSQ